MTRNLNLNKAMIILRGIPGSGKSTFAEFLKNVCYLPKICAADDYMVDSAGNYQFDPKKLGYAHSMCRKAAEDAANEGFITIVIANTNTKRDEFKDYEKIAEKYGYTVFVLTVNNMHGSKSVHNVPDESLQKMRDRFQHFLQADYSVVGQTGNYIHHKSHMQHAEFCGESCGQTASPK